MNTQTTWLPALFALSTVLVPACSDDDDDRGDVERPPGDASVTGDASIDGSTAFDASSGEQDARADPVAPKDGGQTDATSTDASAPALDAAAPRAVTIRFKAEINGADFACGRSYEAVGTTRTTATPADFRFFVQSVALVNAAGVEVPVQLSTRGEWQVPEVGLIDFEDGTGACGSGNAGTNVVLTGTAPPGDYKGIVFVNGIPPALNHGDPAAAPAPLRNAPGSLWSWRFGYKFMLNALAHPETQGLGLIHVGATGCTGSPQTGEAVTCAKPNRNRVQLDGFDPDTNVVVADLGVVMSGLDLTVDSQCHGSGEACPVGYGALGIDFATGTPGTTASAFHVE